MEVYYDFWLRVDVHLAYIGDGIELSKSTLIENPFYII